MVLVASAEQTNDPYSTVWYLPFNEETWFSGVGPDPVSTSAGRRSSACTPSSSGRPPPSAATASSSLGQLTEPADGPGWSSVCRTPAGSERSHRTCWSERKNQRGGERERSRFQKAQQCFIINVCRVFGDTASLLWCPVVELLSKTLLHLCFTS